MITGPQATHPVSLRTILFHLIHRHGLRLM